MVPGREDAGAQAGDEEVEQVEHLLRRPPVLRHAQLDADLRGSSDNVSAGCERERQCQELEACMRADVLNQW